MSWSIFLQLILLTQLVFASATSQHDPYYCYSDDPFKPQYRMFSTKTSYETIRAQSINASVSSCTPSKFWFVSRHGTRLPTTSEIIAINSNYERLQRELIANYRAGRSSLCSADFDLIQNWQFDPNITVDIQQELTLSGWSEFEGMGRRFSQAFPTLLPSTYTPQQFLFRATNTTRTRSSLQAFADGVFGYNGHLDVQFEEATSPDLLLVPYNSCDLFLEVVANNTEHLAFAEGPEFQQSLTEISHKLGFLGARHLRLEDIDLIELLCKYDHIWFLDEPSPWCAAFSVANNEVIEYYNDLSYYWRMGHGPREFRTLFSNHNCHLMQDLLQFITSNDPNDHLSRIYSTHLAIISLLMVTLETFEDQVQLTRHNFAHRTARQWRSSEIIPMGANLAVVKYSCSHGDDNLLFLLNENPLHLPGCTHDGLCKQSLIIERFERFLTGNCSEMFCSN